MFRCIHRKQFYQILSVQPLLNCSEDIQFFSKYGRNLKFIAKSAAFSTNEGTPEMMTVWQVDGFGGLDKLQLSSVRIRPLLKPTEVLVKVSAASVNPIDVVSLSGYGREIFDVMRKFEKIQLGSCDFNESEFPKTVGRDFAGEVVRVGQEATNIKVNDEVWGVVSPQSQGSHAEYVIAEACNIFEMPKKVSFIKAASLPYAALTGWSAAVISGGMKPNDCFGVRVLVIGASGGVGIFLTQLLSVWGAEVVGVCSEDTFELVQSCGAIDVFDYRNPDTVINLTSEASFDLIIDASGLPDIKWAEGLKRWRNASYVTLSSPLLRNTDNYGLFPGVLKSFGELVQQNLPSLSEGRLIKWAFFIPSQSALKDIAKLVTEQKIQPVIDKVFSMNDAVEAYRHVLEGPSRGKTVIDIASGVLETENEQT